MATLITSLPTICFPHEIDTLRIAATEAVDVEIYVDNICILATTLSPVDGTATIEDLAPLLRDYAAEGLHSFGILVDTVQTGTTIIPCNFDTTATAAAFCTTHFLSPLTGEKPTLSTATEYLSLYAVEGTAGSGSTEAQWYAADGTIATTTQALTAQFVTGEISTIDVSPTALTPPTDGAQLISYTVKVGERQQRYRLLPQSLLANGSPVTLQFRNVFGCPDTFHLLGLVERTLKPTRQAAQVAGRYRNITVKAVPTYKAETGQLTAPLLPLLDDLCTCIQPITNTKNGVSLAITDCEVQTTTDPHALPTATITWRETVNVIGWQPRWAVRLFDETFDTTFN